MSYKHILYVEDDSVSRKLMHSFLRKYPHIKLYVVETAELALESISEQEFDLIFMDINLPGIDGRTLSRSLKEKVDVKHIPIIAVSAFAKKDIGIDQEIFEEYIVKPIDFSLLTKHINKYT